MPLVKSRNRLFSWQIKIFTSKKWVILFSKNNLTTLSPTSSSEVQLLIFNTKITNTTISSIIDFLKFNFLTIKFISSPISIYLKRRKTNYKNNTKCPTTLTTLKITTALVFMMKKKIIGDAYPERWQTLMKTSLNSFFHSMESTQLFFLPFNPISLTL